MIDSPTDPLITSSGQPFFRPYGSILYIIGIVSALITSRLNQNTLHLTQCYPSNI